MRYCLMSLDLKLIRPSNRTTIHNIFYDAENRVNLVHYANTNFSHLITILFVFIYFDSHTITKQLMYYKK